MRHSKADDRDARARAQKTRGAAATDAKRARRRIVVDSPRTRRARGGRLARLMSERSTRRPSSSATAAASGDDRRCARHAPIVQTCSRRRGGASRSPRRDDSPICARGCKRARLQAMQKNREIRASAPRAPNRGAKAPPTLGNSRALFNRSPSRRMTQRAARPRLCKRGAPCGMIYSANSRAPNSL